MQSKTMSWQKYSWLINVNKRIFQDCRLNLDWDYRPEVRNLKECSGFSHFHLSTICVLFDFEKLFGTN